MPSGSSEITRLQRWLDAHIGEGRTFVDMVTLARASGLTEGTIRRIRSGSGTTKKTFDRIAIAFGLTPAQFEMKLEELEREHRISSLLDEQIATGIDQLPEEDKQEIYDLIQSKLRRHRKE